LIQGMTIKEVIKKAQEGGYDEPRLLEFCEAQKCDAPMFLDPNFLAITRQSDGVGN